MFEMIEDRDRDFYALKGEARDNLHALMKVGGPDYSYFKLAEHLRTLTPRFDWQEGDVSGFVRRGECRFIIPSYKLRGKDANAVDQLNLDDVLAISHWAAQEIEPILQRIRASGEAIDLPNELIIHDYGNELMFSFQTAAATEFAQDPAFNAAAMRSLSMLVDYFQRHKKGDPQPKLMLDLTEAEAQMIVGKPELVDELKALARKVIAERLAQESEPPADDITPPPAPV